MNSFRTMYILVLMSIVLASCLQAQEIDESQLAEAQFEEIDVTFDSTEDDPEARGLFKKVNKCSCNQKDSCGCCAHPRILGYKVTGCLNFTLFSSEKKLEVILRVQEQQVSKYKFSIAPVDKVCGSLPKKLKYLQFCLFTNTTHTEDHGLTSCTSLDIIYKNTTFAIFNFSCIRLKDGKLDFNFHQDIDRETVFKLKMKNPVMGIKKLIDNMLAKRGEFKDD